MKIKVKILCVKKEGIHTKLKQLTFLYPWEINVFSPFHSRKYNVCEANFYHTQSVHSPLEQCYTKTLL